MCNALDNLIACVTIIDENKLIDQLPIFVAADPDLIPSKSLCEKDMVVLLNKLQCVDDRLSAMQNDLDATSAQHARSNTMTPTVFGESRKQMTSGKNPPSAGEGQDGNRAGETSGGMRFGTVTKNAQL